MEPRITPALAGMCVLGVLCALIALDLLGAASSFAGEPRAGSAAGLAARVALLAAAWWGVRRLARRG